MKRRKFLSLISAVMCTILVANIFTDSTVSALPVKKNLGSKAIMSHEIGSTAVVAGTVSFATALIQLGIWFVDWRLKENMCTECCEGGTWEHSSGGNAVVSMYHHPSRRHAASVIYGELSAYVPANPGFKACAGLHFFFPRRDAVREAWYYVGDDA